MKENNFLKGGVSDKMTLNDIAKKHNIKIEFLKIQLNKGIKEEMEHTNKVEIAKEIAMDHLFDNPKYYDNSKEIKEITDSSSSGSYDVSFSSDKKNPLKIDGVKSIAKSRAVVDKKFPKWGGPDGVYVKIKEKCSKFPYCNQGDINNLEIMENEKLMEDVSKDFNIKPNELIKIIIKETMKPVKISEMIESEVTKQVKKLLKEQQENNDSYNIMCNGKLVDSFDDEEVAKKELEEYKKSHPKQEFIIEKSKKKTFDELDEMCDDETEKDMNEQEIESGNEINPNYTHFAVNKETGKIVNGWEYDEELDKESIAEYCKSDLSNIGLNPKEFKVSTKKFMEKNEINPFDINNWENPSTEDTQIEEIGESKKHSCEKCKKDVCECSTINESKKKNIIIKESDLVRLIQKMINENAQKESKKVNDANTKEVTKKIKDYLKFDGNSNPEFPNANKGDKIKAVHNTKEEDQIVSDNRGKGPQDLVYDNEPKDGQKEKIKKHLTGDSKLGNSQDSPSVIKTKTGDDMVKNAEKRKKLKKEEPLYKKEKIPVTNK